MMARGDGIFVCNLIHHDEGVILKTSPLHIKGRLNPIEFSLLGFGAFDVIYRIKLSQRVTFMS